MFALIVLLNFCKDILHLQVNISLNAANGWLKQTREERDQFDEANNQIIFSLKKKVLEFTFVIDSVLFEQYF